MSVLRLVGTDARFKLNGAVLGKLKNVEFNPRGEFIKGRAAGDPMMVNSPGWLDYELRAQVIFDAAAPYGTAFGALLAGLPLTWAILLHSTDSNAFVNGSGYVSETPTRVPSDDNVEHNATIIPDGTVWTYNQSPA